MLIMKWRVEKVFRYIEELPEPIHSSSDYSEV